MTYTYDGNGKRLQKSSGTLDWYGMGSQVLSETDLTEANPVDYVYFGGVRIARRESGGNVYYYFGNLLGSEVSITNATGTRCYDADFYPFGGEKNFVNTCAQNFKFADMERDGETGLDHTQFRQYSSNTGRWLSPDALGGDITDPQSLNRYAYVLNNPTNATDPLGLQSGSFTMPWTGACTPSGYVSQSMPCQWGGGAPTGIMPLACVDAFCGPLRSPICRVDGLETGCGKVMQMLENRTAAPCPNNHCTNVRFTGTVVQRWVPPQFRSSTTKVGDSVEVAFHIENGYWKNVYAQPCYGGDAFCDLAGNVILI